MDLPYGIAAPGFRLPDETHVGGVHLLVSDLGRSLDYYQRVLGLRRITESADAAALGPAGNDAVLVTLHSRAGVVPSRRGRVGLFHFAILLPDRAALGRFTAHLAALGLRAGMADHLVSEALYLWDPDGLGIEVYADRPRSAWRRNGQELAMATDPLDVPSVLAEGGSVPWEGAPSGTRMGHVHLHVGSLEQAEAFYHRALGLDKMVWTYPGALFMSAGGYHHHLGTNVWSSAPAAPIDEARLLHWELVVPEAHTLPRLAESLIAAGFNGPVAGHVLETADPWGTRVVVVSRR